MGDITVAIIDFQSGNLFSVRQACVYAGLNPVVTCNINEIQHADAVILPGVGAFADAMASLKKLDLLSPIIDAVNSGKPFMGICLGLQLLFTESEEFGLNKGLDIINGKVVKFPSKSLENKPIKVPQIGWNKIFKNRTGKRHLWEESPLRGLSEGEYMYFVHSYYVAPSDHKVILTHTSYEGLQYCSSILYNNVFATQFHPEKSAEKGINIYKNWASLIRGTKEKKK